MRAYLDGACWSRALLHEGRVKMTQLIDLLSASIHRLHECKSVSPPGLAQSMEDPVRSWQPTEVTQSMELLHSLRPAQSMDGCQVESVRMNRF